MLKALIKADCGDLDESSCPGMSGSPHMTNIIEVLEFPWDS